MKKRQFCFKALLILVLLTFANLSYPLSGFFNRLSRHVKAVQSAFAVPGVAVAIVKDGQTVFARGFGFRENGKDLPVDSQTLFAIASNTKAFTCVALAMLVDEGKIKWDDRVITYLPEFQLYDPYVTREFTIRDLLTHRSGLGLGAGDLMIFPPTDFTRKEILRNMKHLKPVSSFRSRFDYDNLLYLVAGEIFPVVAGKSWESFITDRIFKPLGMSASMVDISRFDTTDNIAIPHIPLHGKLIPKSYRYSHGPTNNMGPAGSIISNADDMAKWMTCLLDRGKVPGSTDRIISEKQCLRLWEPQTILRPSRRDGLNSHFAMYALGFGVQDYRGKKIVTHTGGLLGMVSKVTLVPEMNLGIAVLTNQQSGAAFYAITNHILDHYLKVRGNRWITRYQNMGKQSGKYIAEALKKIREKRIKGSKPSLKLPAYAGIYRDSWRGEITISHRDRQLRITFSRTEFLTGRLEHWHHNTFVARWDDRSLEADSFVTFHLNHDGSINHVKMKAVSPATDFSFDFRDLHLVPVQKKDP